MSASGTSETALPGSRALTPPAPPPGDAHPSALAGLGSRFGAAISGLLILAVLALVLVVPLGLFVWAGSSMTEGPAWVMAVIFGSVIFVMVSLSRVHFTEFEGSRAPTPGKRAVGIRIIDVTTGRPPSFGRVLLRHRLRIIDWLRAPYLVGFVATLRTERKQRIGDLIAETAVIRG